MYQPVIGLEIHVELKTSSKMFCSCKNDLDEKTANTNVCPICMGHPGTLPVINQEAVRRVIKTGLALDCDIPTGSKFDRKNYFYPDLPKGYQISQYDLPLCKEGFLNISDKKIRITRVHLEEDTGRLIHPKGSDYSLIDFNRAGVPLMELVTDPDINSAKEAKAFAEELQLILRYLDISDADMEKGQMRVEANISLQEGVELGTKVEIKNLNSFRSVERGIEYELKRQKDLLEDGKKIVQETMGWDEGKGKTVSQREKEKAHDYRYFPEPDLPPLSHTESFIEEIKAEIPELPQQRRDRFKQEYEIGDKEIEVFVQNKELGEYFEKVMSELRNSVKEIETKDKVERDEFLKLAKFTTNYIITDLQGLLKGKSILDDKFLITPENFAQFTILIYKGEISSKIAKMVLDAMFKTGADPDHIIKEKGLVQVSDAGEIEKVVQEVISKNQKVVEDYKKGKANALQFLVGQVMAKTKGMANPQKVNEITAELLTKRK